MSEQSNIPQEQPGYERRKQVFEAMLELIPPDERLAWRERWTHAELCEAAQRRYDDAWTASLRGTTTWGQ